MSEFTQDYTTKSGSKFKIEYDERSNHWKSEMEDEYISAPSLRELKEKLDRKTSAKAKARKVPCLVRTTYSSTLTPGHATSVDDRNYHVRVSYTETSRFGTKTIKRDRVTRNQVYAHTPENERLSAEIAVLAKQQQEIQTKLSTLSGKLTQFDLAQLKDE